MRLPIRNSEIACGVRCPYVLFRYDRASNEVFPVIPPLGTVFKRTKTTKPLPDTCFSGYNRRVKPVVVTGARPHGKCRIGFIKGNADELPHLHRTTDR